MGESARSTLPYYGLERSPQTPYVPLSLSRTFSWLRTRVLTWNRQTVISHLFNQNQESTSTTKTRTRTTTRAENFPRLTIAIRLRSTMRKLIPSTRLSIARLITNKCSIMRELSSLLHYSPMTMTQKNRPTQVYAKSQDLNRHEKCTTKSGRRKRLSHYGTKSMLSASFQSQKKRSLRYGNRPSAGWTTSTASRR